MRNSRDQAGITYIGYDDLEELKKCADWKASGQNKQEKVSRGFTSRKVKAVYCTFGLG